MTQKLAWHRPRRATVNRAAARRSRTCPGREGGKAVALSLFLLLLLANLVFFALMRSASTAGEEAAPSHRAVNADKIKLVGPPPPQAKHDAGNTEAAVGTPAGGAAVAPDGAPSESPEEGAAQTAASVPAAPPAAKKPPVCLEWGPFAGNELARAGRALGALNLNDRVSRKPILEAGGYWVYIPPLGSRQAALSKIAELKRLGVSDYLLIQGGGQWQNAISLGVLSTEAAAQTLLAQLRRKGVTSAQAGPRTVESKRAGFLIRDADDALTAKLVELKQSFPGSELQAVACP